MHLRKERFPKLRQNKLMPRAAGPYQIKSKVGDNAYVVDMNTDFGVHHTFNIGDLAPYHNNEELGSILFEEGEDAPSIGAEPTLKSSPFAIQSGQGNQAHSDLTPAPNS